MEVYSQSTVSSFLLEKIKALFELTKPRLSFLVVFSSGFGYLLATPTFGWANCLVFLGGGFLVSGASASLNQVIESKYDALMKRTSKRPVPTKRVSKEEGVLFASLILVLGLVCIYLASNLLATLLSLLSFILYAFIYTPMKRKGSISVFIGAFPGALPPLIGWVAASGGFSYEVLLIFGIQFIWQFPHFWAIAWVSDEDYKKAGFKLLPGNGKKDLNTAINIMIYTLFLLPIGLLPAYFGLTGTTSAFIVTICGVLFLSQTFSLMKDTSTKKAKMIMFASFLYLPIVQLSFLLDKL